MNDEFYRLIVVDRRSLRRQTFRFQVLIFGPRARRCQTRHSPRGAEFVRSANRSRIRSLRLVLNIQRPMKHRVDMNFRIQVDRIGAYYRNILKRVDISLAR